MANRFGVGVELIDVVRSQTLEMKRFELRHLRRNRVLCAL